MYQKEVHLACMQFDLTLFVRIASKGPTHMHDEALQDRKTNPFQQSDMVLWKLRPIAMVDVSLGSVFLSAECDSEPVIARMDVLSSACSSFMRWSFTPEHFVTSPSLEARVPMKDMAIVLRTFSQLWSVQHAAGVAQQATIEVAIESTSALRSLHHLQVAGLAICVSRSAAVVAWAITRHGMDTASHAIEVKSPQSPHRPCLDRELHDMTHS